MCSRVLLLEDSQPFAELFMNIFSDVVEVVHVATFKEFQRAVVSGSFSMVVSDVNVPMFGGDGPQDYSLQAVYEARKYLGTDVPLVFITSEPTETEAGGLGVPVFDKMNTLEWKQHVSTCINTA